MLVTIAMGLQVNAAIGCLVFRVPPQKASPDEGGLPIIGFSEGLIQVQLASGDVVLVSGDGIEALACPAEPPVEVILTDGSTVVVPQSSAPIVQALVAAQQVALDQIRELLDVTQVGQLQTELAQVKGDLSAAQVLLQKRTDALAAIASTAQAALG